MANRESMVETFDLVKAFDDPERGVICAVDHLCFSASPGRILGLLGPNGAGKTTTLRLLSTVLSPTAGTARVNGFDLVTNPAAVRRNIGFLSGTTGVYGRLTPTEMLRYFGSLYGLPEETIAARTAEIFTRFDMHEFAHTPCERLSTGMKQKVSIARTILHDPPVLMLDEPTSGLDPLAARTMHQFIRESADRGRCVLFSTHLVGPAEELCDDLAILHQGRFLVYGSLAELRQSQGVDRLEEIFSRVVEAKAAPASGADPAQTASSGPRLNSIP